MMAPSHGPLGGGHPLRSARWIPVLLLASACGDADPPVVVEVHDDGPVVMNLLETEAVPRGTLRLLWSLTADEWGEPSTVRIGEAGLVAVVDPLAVRVHVLGSEGEPVARWGEQGDGPGEWRGVANAVFEGEHLLVQPSSAGHLERFTREGEFLDRVEVGQALGLIGVVGTEAVGVSRAQMAAVAVVDLSGEDAVRTLSMGPTPERYTADEYGTCWRHAVTSDAVFRLSCSAGRIQEVGLDGTHRRWIELADGPRRSTEEELDAYAERVWHEASGGRELDPVLARQLDAIRAGVEIRPKYQALRADAASGRLFLLEHPFGDYGEGDAVLHVVDRDGRHAMRIETGKHVRSFDVAGDTVAFLVRDDMTGVVGLEVHLLATEAG
jgi:hypothetical protein